MKTPLQTLHAQFNPQNFPPLHPDYVTGFTDAEGCFNITLDTHPTRYYAQFIYCIKLATIDYLILFRINSFFNNSGSVTLSANRNYVNLRFSSREAIKNYIIPHFDKSPLYSQKSVDYLLFREAFMISESPILTREDKLTKLVPLILSLNTGIRNQKTALIKKFQEITPAPRPPQKIPQELKPWWVTGFTDGDGSFTVSNQKKAGVINSAGILFDISQHPIDHQLMSLFLSFFQCGKLRAYPDITRFVVQGRIILIKKIIPHFDTYPLQARRGEVYKLWRELLIFLGDDIGGATYCKNKSYIIEFINKIQATYRLKRETTLNPFSV